MFRERLSILSVACGKAPILLLGLVGEFPSFLVEWVGGQNGKMWVYKSVWNVLKRYYAVVISLTVNCN